MIIRKPYAFLIKNFKKIHVVLLIASLFVLYKIIDVSNFVRDYMNYGTYDAYSNPISKHITLILLLFIFILMVGTASLIFLLRYKKKPWKVYLIPFIEYTAMFFILRMIKSFFLGYTYSVETTDLKMSRDLLFIFQIFQLPAIAIYAMRVFGLDINKFNFNSDKEFFELSEKDREEIEISLSVDQNSFIRLFKRLIRNLGYFYTEHKRICNVIGIIIAVIMGYNAFKFVFITNRVYSQGHNYNVNGYTFKVNNSYFTDKGLNGEVLSPKSNFVVLDITVTNNSSPRKINLDRFHLKNGSYDYITTRKVYEKEFSDFGKTYDSVKEMKRGETFNFIIIYKVEKKLRKGGFVLYYQEGNYLRKIKLKVKDVSKITTEGTYKIGDDFTFTINNNEETISFDDYKIDDKTTITYNKCNVDGCTLYYKKYQSPMDKTILKLNFSSYNFEYKDIVDFSSEYGKIVYVDNESIESEIEFKIPFNDQTSGKTLYVLVPRDFEDAKSIKFIYTIRNKQYEYIVK